MKEGYMLTDNKNDVASSSAFHSIGKRYHAKGIDRLVIGFGRVTLEGFIMEHESITGRLQPTLLTDNR